jgi:uncharacterized membrane protein YfhO
MLNCKYIIGADSLNRKGLIPRPTANGNAWYVDQLVGTANAKLEMDKLKTINVKAEATFNGDFEVNKELKAINYTKDSFAYAKLNSYHPDTMKYEVSNANAGYIVFSEIYYDNWKVLVDGKESKLNKVNYTLRGLAVPAGKHTIVCYFDKGNTNSDQIDFITSVLILVVLGISILLWLKSYFVKA